jgi:hypothetical protein
VFSLWLLLRSWSSGVFYCVVGLIGASVLNKPAAFILKVEKIIFFLNMETAGSFEILVSCLLGYIMSLNMTIS